MPTYEYKCDACGRRFEQFRSIMDDTPVNCPACKAQARRLISSGGGIIMKGNAFHSAENKPRCGKDHTCCGRDTPCEKPSCEE